MWEQSFLIALYRKFLLNFQYSYPAVPLRKVLLFILNKALLLTLQLNRESVNIFKWPMMQLIRIWKALGQNDDAGWEDDCGNNT